MIEKKLMSIIFNYPNLIAKLKINGNIFTDTKLNHIYNVIETLPETWNFSLLCDKIKDSVSITEMIEIQEFESGFSDAYFNLYYMHVLKNHLKQSLKKLVVEISKDKDIDFAGIKFKTIDLLNQIKSINEQEIETAQNACKKLVSKLSSDLATKKITSCIDWIDDFKGGYETFDYIIIGAAESEGKTSFVIDTIVKQLKQNMSIGFISCEMNKEKIYQLFACNIAGVDENRVDMNSLTELEKVNYINAIEKLYEKNLYIFDASRNWYDLKEKIKIMKNKYNIDMVYIDYLQYLRIPKINDQFERLQIISSEIKENCKELEIPHCVIASLNNEGKKREEPEMFDIKGNGDIAYDTDICFLIKTKNQAIGGDENKRLVNFYVKKYRNGRRGMFSKVFHCSIRRFINVSYNE